MTRKTAREIVRELVGGEPPQQTLGHDRATRLDRIMFWFIRKLTPWWIRAHIDGLDSKFPETTRKAMPNFGWWAPILLSYDDETLSEERRTRLSRKTRLATGEALQLLLMALDEQVFVGPGPETSGGGPTIRLEINVGDTFYMACADSEPIPVPWSDEYPHPFWDLYDLVRVHGDWGAVLWVALQRQARPLDSVVAHLEKLGLWTDEIDALVSVKT